jgi:DNA-binding XRE family transcriptional regulator
VTDPAPILALLRAGKTATDTATETGVSVPTVRKIAREAGIRLRSGNFAPDMLPPEAVRARLDALANGHPRADLARAIGVSRQRVSTVEREGVSASVLEGWAQKILAICR